MKRIFICTVLFVLGFVSQNAFAQIGKAEHAVEQTKKLEEYKTYFENNGYTYQQRLSSENDDQEGYWFKKENITVCIAWEMGYFNRSDVHVHRVIIRGQEKSLYIETEYGKSYYLYEYNANIGQKIGEPLAKECSFESLEYVLKHVSGYQQYAETVKEFRQFFEKGEE